MAKPFKWLCALLSLKKPHRRDNHPQTTRRLEDTKRSSDYREETAAYEEDPTKHAIAVAAATAAVAAARAAVEVVRLTSRSRRCAVSGNYGVSSSAYVSTWREDLAAVKIQSAFRGYLARRALRALKALVRLQALVRGHIQRKRTAEWLHRMQALVEAQARACARHRQIPESSYSTWKSSHFHHLGTGSRCNCRGLSDDYKAKLSFDCFKLQTAERSSRGMYLRRNGAIYNETGNPHFPCRHRYLSCSLLTSNSDRAGRCPFSEDHSFTLLTFPHEVDKDLWTTNNSPQLHSASSRGGSWRSPFNPRNSDGSINFLSGHSDYYPKYMSYTESSRAKVRSLSAPKQRLQYERSSSTNRHSIKGFDETRSSSVRRASALRASFTTKAYPGSCRIDRLDMPVGDTRTST